MTALKEMRIRRNIKQSELARRLNVTRSSVNHNEKRGISCVKTAELYAAILHCRPEELMDFHTARECRKPLSVGLKKQGRILRKKHSRTQV